LARRFAILVAILILAALVPIGYQCLAPYQGFGQPVFVEIERGMSSRAIADSLAGEGVVRTSWIFLAIRATHPRARLQAGEYRFETSQTPWQVFEKIRRGDIFHVDLTVPEGSNIFDIASLLEESGGAKSADFLRAGRAP